MNYKSDNVNMEGGAYWEGALISKIFTFGRALIREWAFIRSSTVKSVQSALSDLKRPPERLQSLCNYRSFIT